MALAEKGVTYDETEVDLVKRPPELFTLNPKGGVPVLVDEQDTIPESLAILEYLEHRFPDPPLLPGGANGRERALSVYKRVNVLLAPHMLKVARGGLAERAEAEGAVRAALASLEEATPDHGFLCGDLSIANLALASFVAKLPSPIRPTELGLPRLSRWEVAVFTRPAVAHHTAPRRPHREATGA